MPTCRCDCRRFAGVAPGLALVIAASAQEPSSPSGALVPDEEVQRVIVTGSQIPRIDGETALPVQIIDREEIARSGVQSVEELVGRLSASFGNFVEAYGVSDDVHPGFSGASLHGLGSKYTLVLLNGRRVANHAFSAEDGVGVDLHVVPLAAIDRVEILKDGASAIYGSDAIAGVINFVLRPDYRGAEASATRQFTEAGGGELNDVNLTAGVGDPARDGYNLFAVIDRQQQHGLAPSQRAFVNGWQPALGIYATSSNSFPANIFVPGIGLYNPAAPACTATTVFVNGACRTNFTLYNDLISPSDSLGLLSRATLALPDASHVVAEVLWSRHRGQYTNAPGPVNSPGIAGNADFYLPASSPFYPQGLGLQGDIVDPRYRSVPLGPRIYDSGTTAQRLLLGWQGRLGEWNLDTAVIQATTHETLDYVHGYLDSARFVAAFDTGLINPFGDSGPMGDALLASTELGGRGQEATGTTRSVDFLANRDLAQWSAGPLTLGLGAELRSETLSHQTTAANDEIIGSVIRTLPTSGSRDQQSAYAELALPIVATLDAQLAVRADHYNDFGTGISPKAAVRWRPAQALVVRASIGSGYRAPSLPELYTPQQAFVSSVVEDPIRCPVTHLDADCFVEVPVSFGGNPLLQPEHSSQASAGFVFQPARDASIGIDWWRIHLRDAITELTDALIVANPGQFEGRNIVRGPVDPAWPTLPGPITSLVEINQNVASQVLSGIDLALDARSPGTAAGRFSASLDGSWLAQFDSAFDGVHVTHFAGQYGYPRWQHTLTLGWDRDAWNATLVQTSRAGFVDANPDANGQPRKVAPWRVWDAQLAWLAPHALAMALGAKNLLDTKPPFSNQTGLAQIGYDPGYADPRGRVWYVRASLRWP